MALGKSTKDIASERFLSIYTVMTHRKIFPETGCQQRPRSHPSCTPLGPCRRCGILHLNSVFLIKEDSPQKHTAQSKDSAHRCQEAIQRYSCLHIPGCRASCRAAKTAAPDEIPVSKPSCKESSRPVRIASSSATRITYQRHWHRMSSEQNRLRSPESYAGPVCHLTKPQKNPVPHQ